MLKMIVRLSALLLFITINSINNFSRLNQTASEERSEINRTSIFPIGDEIHNNGGTILQYGDCIYLSDYENGFQVMRVDGSKPLLSTPLVQVNVLYAAKDCLYFTETVSLPERIDYFVARLTLSTGAVTRLDKGSLCYLDTTAKELYYTKYDPDDSKAGIYKVSTDSSTPIRLCSNDYSFVKKDGDIIYLEGQNADGELTLASINSDGSDWNIFAVISYQDIFGPDHEPLGSLSIIDFDFCGEWIVLSAGYHRGTAQIFSGGLIRMKKDGSELSYIDHKNWGNSELLPDTKNFEIINDWIYVVEDGSSTINGEPQAGCYRFTPDLSKKEYLGNEISYMLNYSAGTIYYSHNDEKENVSETVISDLMSCNPDIENLVTLYDGALAPHPAEHDYAVSYHNVESVGDYVYFNVNVQGYLTDESWRGHTCFYGHYRVRKDGSGLEAIFESEILCQP